MPGMVDRRRAEHSDMTPAQRTERARQAAYARWDANPYDRSAATQSARDAFMDRFENQVDPEGLLDPKTRAKRADKAMRRYFKDLSSRRHKGQASD